MNAIFVANKPIGVSSNRFLTRLKRKYGVKKAGFSGTLDPFASGCLLVALGSYTRFFNYINKTPKVYIATIWFGAQSESLDNENISEVKNVKELNLSDINRILSDLTGEIAYTPPKFSAKHINGTRAYKLAREGVEFKLKEQIMRVYEAQILSYMHPFLTVKLSVDEGSYIRSYAQILASKLGEVATLSALHRQSEGGLKFENEKFLNPLEILNLPHNEYLGDIGDLMDGKKLSVADFKERENKIYLISFDKFLSIIEIKDQTVTYRLNKATLC
ncbi:tRNA pseudouridine(55) synthase TruB [Campylobacter sp. MOP51]|uniref:tRNA pseudouridine(55) synthase TruB n=1 Tax=Campylobacter canis TaxID=3378588 RepID=UPI003C3F8846